MEKEICSVTRAGISASQWLYLQILPNQNTLFLKLVDEQEISAIIRKKKCFRRDFTNPKPFDISATTVLTLAKIFHYAITHVQHVNSTFFGLG